MLNQGTIPQAAVIPARPAQAGLAGVLFPARSDLGQAGVTFWTSKK